MTGTSLELQKLMKTTTTASTTGLSTIQCESFHIFRSDGSKIDESIVEMEDTNTYYE